MVIFLEGGKHEEEDRFLRACVDQDFLWLHGFINPANFGTQRRAPLRFGVTEPRLLKSFARARF